MFGKFTGATENSLLGAGRSLIVENNYGYQDPFGPNAGVPTTQGFARVDVDKDGKGCRRVWVNHDAAAPTVVPRQLAAAHRPRLGPIRPGSWTGRVRSSSLSSRRERFDDGLTRPLGLRDREQGVLVEHAGRFVVVNRHARLSGQRHEALGV